MKEKINYIIFGILTVIVNLSIFYGLLYFFNDNNNIILMLINIIAFIVAIIFAYCTNTIYVFKQ
uniref:GtrA family protein n=1 Tax=Megamonas funiformis TaxID=437897 RepID=UPI00349E7442